VKEQTDFDRLKIAIETDWLGEPGEKVRRYVGRFFERTRAGRKIMAKVTGNHGVDTVSIEAKGEGTVSACSCYIGRGGGCHHCYALARTFLNDAGSFRVVRKKQLRKVATLEDLGAYLRGTTLDELLKDLKAAGIKQKDFAESIGMNPRHLSSIRSSELRNRYYNELGATKLACLWVIEHIRTVTSDG
jgi:uncharacterized Zn finger protein